jgi:hypothetical protein
MAKTMNASSQDVNENSPEVITEITIAPIANIK